MKNIHTSKSVFFLKSLAKYVQCAILNLYLTLTHTKLPKTSGLFKSWTMSHTSIEVSVQYHAVHCFK